MAPRRMAPRRKVGLSRLDAALNFFDQMGFKRGRVRKAINGLLKIYGGDDGWPFIEDSSYKVVLDALFEEDDQGKALVENKGVDAPVEDESVDALVEDESAVALIEHSRVDASLEDVDVPLEDEELLNAEHVNAVLEDALLEHANSVLEDENMVSQIDDSRLADIKVVGVRKLFTDQDAGTANIAPQDIYPRKRKPCYGWLSDDEDEVLPKSPKKLVRLCIQ